MPSSTTLMKLLDRIRNRTGDPLLLRRFKDYITARMMLSPKTKASLKAELGRCKTIGDLYDFSNSRKVFAPHQIKSEIVSFLEFARTHEPKLVLEIGTADGGTHFLLGHGLPTVTSTIAVDLFVWNASILRSLNREPTEQRFIHASSYDPATIQQVANTLAGRPIDLLFIDGDHTYEGAKKDYLGYRHFVREGGIIAFHDIMPDYKTRYGRDTGRWAGDVPILWNELKHHYEHHEFVDSPDQDGLGIGVLIHRSEIVQLP